MRIIDLIVEKKYDELKTVLETKVAQKVVDKIKTKKENFLEKIRSPKEEK